MRIFAHSLGALILGSLPGVAFVESAAAQSSSYRDCSNKVIEAGADLHRCNLRRAVLIGLDLHGINLSRANLRDVNGGCDPDLPPTVLTDARIYRADVRDALLCDAALIRADLHNSDLRRVSFEDANLSNANLSEANLEEVTAAFAIFTDARAANALFRYGVAGSATFDGVDFHGADLRDTYLVRASFVDANLRGARLGRADLTEADLTGADLHDATGLSSVVWNGTTCPDGTNSDANGGTCRGHLH